MFVNILLILGAYMLAAMAADAFSSAHTAYECWKEAHKDNKALRKRAKQLKEQNKKYIMAILRLNIADEFQFLNNGRLIDPRRLEVMAYRAYCQMRDYNMFGEFNENKHGNRIVI